MILNKKLIYSAILLSIIIWFPVLYEKFIHIADTDMLIINIAFYFISPVICVFNIIIFFTQMVKKKDNVLIGYIGILNSIIYLTYGMSYLKVLFYAT